MELVLVIGIGRYQSNLVEIGRWNWSTSVDLVEISRKIGRDWSMELVEISRNWSRLVQIDRDRLKESIRDVAKNLRRLQFETNCCQLVRVGGRPALQATRQGSPFLCAVKRSNSHERRVEETWAPSIRDNSQVGGGGRCILLAHASRARCRQGAVLLFLIPSPKKHFHS